MINYKIKYLKNIKKIAIHFGYIDSFNFLTLFGFYEDFRLHKSGRINTYDFPFFRRVLDLRTKLGIPNEDRYYD